MYQPSIGFLIRTGPTSTITVYSLTLSLNYAPGLATYTEQKGGENVTYFSKIVSPSSHNILIIVSNNLGE